MHAHIAFRKDEDRFWQVLKERVQGYFVENKLSTYANGEWWARAVLMIMLFTVPYLALVISGPAYPLLGVFCCVLMGFGMAGVGMAISHQASHRSVSRRTWVNRLMSLSFNLTGMSDYIWHIKHDVYHHSYTNVFELDEALKEGDALRLSPDAPWKWYHHGQQYRAPFIYALFTIFWAFVLDVEKLFRYNAYGSRKKQPHPAGEVFLFWFTKLYYIGIAFVIPYLMGFSALQIFIGFLIVHLIASSIITHVLQVEHLNTACDLVSPDAGGMVHKSWAKNQLEGTANFHCKSRLFRWYIAGVNYQVEHHLFPRINAIHYPAISAIIRQTAAEFGFKYTCFSSFGQAIRSHYQLLKSLGQKPEKLLAYDG